MDPSPPFVQRPYVDWTQDDEVQQEEGCPDPRRTRSGISFASGEPVCGRYRRRLAALDWNRTRAASRARRRRLGPCADDFACSKPVARARLPASRRSDTLGEDTTRRSYVFAGSRPAIGIKCRRPCREQVGHRKAPLRHRSCRCRLAYAPHRFSRLRRGADACMQARNKEARPKGARRRLRQR